MINDLMNTKKKKKKNLFSKNLEIPRNSLKFPEIPSL